MLQVAEIFGHPYDNRTKAAGQCRAHKRCPFRDAPCTKDNKRDPLRICSLSDGDRLAVLCPARFVEDDRVFVDAGRVAFGPDARIIAVPEVSVLRAGRDAKRKVGKVDYLITRLDDNDRPIDFAALEVQAVYFSGASIRPILSHYLENGELPKGATRRPDWRSSAQKRLMPQLSLKIPLFRRWGKKVFVAVDSRFYDALPPMRTVDSVANSEVTWLVYPFARCSQSYQIGSADPVYTTWDDVLTALREGDAPSPDELLDDVERKRRKKALRILTT